MSGNPPNGEQARTRNNLLRTARGTQRPDAALARCAWHGFNAINAGDPDHADPFDTGAVDAIANILIAVALDPHAIRTLEAVTRAALEHALTELGESDVLTADTP